jgi:hypothetical protein
MIPSRFQEPPKPDGASHNATNPVPTASIRFSFPLAKNPIDFPSGDQNGCDAPSVPGSGCAERPSSGRTHKSLLPSADVATKASRLPSADTAIGLASRVEERKLEPSGGDIEDLTKFASAGLRVNNFHVINMDDAKRIAAIVQAASGFAKKRFPCRFSFNTPESLISVREALDRDAIAKQRSLVD